MSKVLTEMFEKAGLPTDFAGKAEVLFEAAVAEKVQAEIAAQSKTLQEAFDAKLEQSKQEFIAEQAETFDSIVQEAIVEWIETNSAQLDANLKSEVLEGVVTHLKEAFAANQVVVPEGAQLLESIQAKATATEAELAAAQAELAESQRTLLAYGKADIVAELTEGLSDLAAERIAKIAVAVNEDDLTKFRSTVETLVEAFGGKVTDGDKEVKDGDNKKAEEQGKVNEGEVPPQFQKKDDEDDKGVDSGDKEDDSDEEEVTESTNPLIAATLAILAKNTKK